MALEAAVKGEAEDVAPPLNDVDQGFCVADG